MGHTLWTIRVKAVRYTSLSQSLLSDSRNAHPPQYVILNYLFTFTKQSTYKTEGRRAMSMFWKKRTKTIEKIFVEINDFYLGQAIFGRICVVWNTKMGCQAPSVWAIPWIIEYLENLSIATWIIQKMLYKLGVYSMLYKYAMHGHFRRNCQCGLFVVFL